MLKYPYNTCTRRYLTRAARRLLKIISKNNVNKIIRALIVSGFFLFFSLGLLMPIFAIFILNNIED